MPDYLSRVHHDDTYQGEYEPEVGCKLFTINEEETKLTMASIMREQLKDGELAQVMKYLEEGDLPIDGEEALHVMNLSDHKALLPPGVLYRCANKTNKKQKYTQLMKIIMVPTSLVSNVLKLLHNCYISVSRRPRWCDRPNYGTHYKALARSWDAPTRPWEVVQCDFIGPLKTAKDGSKYIMTFIDLLTGWPEAFCTKDSTAKTAAEVFLYGIICRYGKVD